MLYNDIDTSFPLLVHNESEAFETLHVASIEIIDSTSRICLSDRMKQGTSTNVVLKITIALPLIHFVYFPLGNQSAFDRLIGQTNRTK